MKYLIVAEREELALPKAQEAMQTEKRKPIVVGVGMVNAIYSLSHLPKDSDILNVGYCGSNDLEVGTEVQIKDCRTLEQGQNNEPTFTLGRKGASCYTAHTFIEDSTTIPDGCVVDMELAAICAMDFAKVEAVKYVSDNMDYNDYRNNKAGQKCCETNKWCKRSNLPTPCL